jgi:hypothetical protein
VYDDAHLYVGERSKGFRRTLASASKQACTSGLRKNLSSSALVLPEEVLTCKAYSPRLKVCISCSDVMLSDLVSCSCDSGGIW